MLGFDVALGFIVADGADSFAEKEADACAKVNAFSGNCISYTSGTDIFPASNRAFSTLLSAATRLSGPVLSASSTVDPTILISLYTVVVESPNA